MRLQHTRELYAMLFLLTLLCSALGDPPTRRPAALERAIAARSGELLKTVKLDYVRHDRAPESRFGPHSYFYSWCAAGDERIATFWGDEEGVCVREENGRPAKSDREQGPQSTLQRDAEIWQHRDDSIRARVSTAAKTVELMPRYERFFDMRLLGLDPFGADLDIESHARDYGINEVIYDSRQEDNLIVVTAALPPSGKVYWWIDPNRDYAVVKTASEQDGRRILETEYSLEKIDGVWFPQQIDRYRMDSAGRRIKPAVESIEFLATEFNRPEHPRHFSPTDIGIDTGVNVSYDDPTRKAGIWDGGAVISIDTYAARLKSGDLKPGPNVIRVLRQRAEFPPAEDEPAGTETSTSADGRAALGFSGAAARMRTRLTTEWERYTRDFIRRFELDQPQTERAKAVLAECEERASKLVSDRKETLTHWGRQITKPEMQAKASDAMSRELKELRSALQREFDEQLKPRLDKLPTRAQRAAATAATTQPAKASN